MATMMPPIAITSALPPLVGDGCGTGVAVNKTDVAVDITGVAVTVLVWVGICI